MSSLSRRHFFVTASLAGLSAALLDSRAGAAQTGATRKPRGPEEVKALLEGPVNSIPTTFLPNGELDWKGVRNAIETGITGGSEVALLTRGDSQFAYLLDQEVEELTRVLVDQAGSRVLTVAATQPWWTGEAVQFARFCRDLGVDILMVSPPAGSTDGLIAHYRAIAEVMPIMFVGHVADAVLDGLADVPSACTYKEDYTIEWALEAIPRYRDRMKFMTGGGLARHYQEWDVEVTAFMSWPSSFAPWVAQRYWRAVQAGRERAVRRILDEVEAPFFEAAMDFSSGFHAFWRAAMEVNGVASRWLRPPQGSASEEQVEEIRTMMGEWGLLA